MDARYDAWNIAIGQHFYGPKHAGQNVFLIVDQDTLWQISKDYGAPLQFTSSAEAVDDFVAAVRREICQRGGWTLGALQSDKHPLFLGFLALQILSVFKMHGDEKWTAHAYWGRLRELLDDTTASYMPLGLNPAQHQVLWRQGLERWANNIQRERWGTVRLPLPEQLGSERDHVGLPKSQALLTLADLHRLPDFYHEADFRPGEDLEVEIIQQRIEKLLLDKPSLFRRHAQRVLRDERRNLACIQIRDHLRQWGGDNTLGKARLWLQVRDYDPPKLDGGLIIGDTPIPGVRLGNVLGCSGYRYAPHRIFRPLRERYYVTVQDVFRETWDERRYAKPGEEVLLLVWSGDMRLRFEQVCHDVAEHEEVKQYYAEGDAHPPDSITLRGLPRGWCALRFRVHADLPVTLPHWCKEWLHYAHLQLIGGLRVGRQTWMAGAGPTVLVRAPDVTTVCIDGRFYEVTNRRVTPYQAPCLNEPGLHIAQVEGGSLLKITIEEHSELPEIQEPSGWVSQEQEWPSPEWAKRQEHSLVLPTSASLTLRGAVVRGQPVQPVVIEPSVQRHWIELVLQLRGYGLGITVSAAETRKAFSHPLIRQLQMIAGAQRQFCPGNIHS